MQATELSKIVTETLDDNKAVDIRCIEVTELTDVADYFVICSATSNRHAKALADKVIESAKQREVRPLGVEGEESAEWILIDLADVIVHIMLADAREFYSLEKLWTVAEAHREKQAS